MTEERLVLAELLEKAGGLPRPYPRLGALQLRIPKLRQGSYFPPFLEARKSSEKALIAVAFAGPKPLLRCILSITAINASPQAPACYHNRFRGPPSPPADVHRSSASMKSL
jgi:hypothetical protein